MNDYRKLHDAQSIAWEWGQGVTDAETAIRKLHKLFPIDGAPASGVRAGMLRAADICDVMARDGYTGTANDALAFASNLIMSEAITRAADQVNAEGHKPGCLADGECICFSAPHSASQPDTVAVPRDQLEHWSEYWNGSANEKAMSDALEHILDEVDDLLRAAQEAK